MATYSSECLRILELLKNRKNVLITGAPACGKTRLLNEVADAFISAFVKPQTAVNPTHVVRPVSLPRSLPTTGGQPLPELPSPTRTQRQVFRTAFNANSKPRDFLSGLMPTLGAAQQGPFRVTHGKLIQANRVALLPDGAALLIIDELNRGPAVQLFGDAIVAIEADKRLGEDGQLGASSWPIDVLNTQTGETEPMHLSGHLYILAAMNQADVSVEPLDVAFIRRWERYPLSPSDGAIRDQLGATGPDAMLPGVPATPGDVVEAAVRAWAKVNERVEVGRGAEFMLGHGVFLGRRVLSGSQAQPFTSVDEALNWALESWGAIYAHVEEVFFGDAFGIAATLRADGGSSHYRMESHSFGQDQRQTIRKPTLDAGNIYALLLWVGQA